MYRIRRRAPVPVQNQYVHRSVPPYRTARYTNLCTTRVPTQIPVFECALYFPPWPYYLLSGECRDAGALDAGDRWGMGGLSSSLVLEPEENIEVLPYFPQALHGTEYRRLVVGIPLGTLPLSLCILSL